MTTDALTTIEAERLEVLENIIERGLTNFIDVGRALKIIREERLYRLTHKTFDDYTRDRFGMSRQRAHQLISWEAVDASLSTVVDKPQNEAQARELAKVEPEQREEVWTAAQVEFETPQPTASEIKQVRERREKPVDIECADEDREQRLYDAIERAIRECRKIDNDISDAKYKRIVERVLSNKSLAGCFRS